MGIGHSFTKEYGGRKFCVGVRDLLGAPTDTIVNPANSGLSHGGGVAEQIGQFAGEAFLRDSREVVAKRGRVPITQAVITVAGNLPFKGIINAVGPRMTEPNVAEKLEQTIANTPDKGCPSLLAQRQITLDLEHETMRGTFIAREAAKRTAPPAVR